MKVDGKSKKSEIFKLGWMIFPKILPISEENVQTAVIRDHGNAPLQKVSSKSAEVYLLA